MKRIVALTVLVCVGLPVLVSQADTNDDAKHVVGPWQLKMTTPDGQARAPVVVVGRQYDEYVAWYFGKDGPEALKRVRLKDDSMVGTLKPKELPGVTVKLEARLKGDNACEGVGTYRDSDGDSGSWEFTGKRIALSFFDEVTEWQIEFVTPEFERHSATVTIVSKGSQLYAWYSGKDRELPALDVKVDGDKGVMKMCTVTRDGEKIDLVFRGTVDGDRIEGDIEYKLSDETGSFPFTAKRKS